MALKFFHIRTRDAEAMESELNSFLSRHRIVTIERRFVDCGLDSFWALCVDYLHGEPTAGANHGAPGRADRKVDYKEVLNPEQFEIFAKLRDLSWPHEFGHGMAKLIYGAWERESVISSWMIHQEGTGIDREIGKPKRRAEHATKRSVVECEDRSVGFPISARQRGYAA